MEHISRFSPRLALLALGLSLSACVATKAYAAEPVTFQAAPSAPSAAVDIPDPGDLSNGFYPQLRTVGINDAEFKLKVQWLNQAGAPWPTRIVADKAICLQGSPCTPKPGGYMPAGVWFSKDGRELVLDAILLFNFPSVALTDLEVFYHFGDPKVLKVYVGPTIATRVVLLSPVGEPWPDKCAELCFRAAAGDNYPWDYIYTDASGQYVKERTWFAFFPTGALWRKVKI